MTRQLANQTQQQTSTTSPLSSGILQRKCVSCGQHTIAGGECGECQKKRSPLQRRAINGENISDVPPLNSYLFRKSCFDHDFSHIPVHTGVPVLIQPKLTISAVGDRYEQEADRVAEQVMSMAAPTTPGIQRQTEDDESEKIQPKSLVGTITPIVQRQEESEDEELIQAKCETCEQDEYLQRSPDSIGQAQPNLESRLNTSKDGGSPLSEEVRSFMEPRFGADFSRVRVHTDGDAVQMNRELEAQAFTYGSDIYYGSGKAPGNNNLTAHELTHVIQQSEGITNQPVISLSQTRLLQVRSPFVARQAVPVPVRPPIPARPPLRVIPGGRTDPGGRALPTPEGGPRYAPDPYDNSFEAALERANIRDNAERVRIQAERPMATLDRGGQPPNFITVVGTQNYSWLGGPGGGGSVRVRIREFHVLDAIEYDVSQATNEDQLGAVLERYFPLEALLNQGIEISQRRQRVLSPNIRFPLFPLWDEPVYPQRFDPRAEARLQVFQASVQRRVQAVPALAQSRLVPKGRRRGGCRIEPISPLGDDPMSTLYCHIATGSPYSYKITIESSTGELTQRWAEIDALRGNTWYECKCGYEALLRGADRRERVAQSVLDSLTRQVLNHVYIARTCGLEYRYIVSNNYVAETLRRSWFGNVVIDVVPFEGCN